MNAPRVVFERRGTGEPLVLLHGIGHHWRAWLPVLDRLAEVHDVVAVDLPGFGQSPLPDVPPTDMHGLVDAVVEIFTELGLERPHVAGNSLGGAIALELAGRGQVASATALSPAGFCSSRELRWALGVLSGHRMAARLPEPVLRAMFRVGVLRHLSFGMILARPGRLTVETALADAQALRAAKAFRMIAKAGRGYAFSGVPAVPVTVAWGTRDRILPYRQSRQARTRLPQARHVDLTGCGHVPMHDDPELVASVILATTGAITPDGTVAGGPEGAGGDGFTTG
ncbi:alpha/beta fold hydrolase [Melissospora conviva]|uniref:alpha/beta fold hydrolase n=1 Tax=Melissospora conviva TaxID=3388432 RepID=UPI003C1F2296